MPHFLRNGFLFLLLVALWICVTPPTMASEIRHHHTSLRAVWDANTERYTFGLGAEAIVQLAMPLPDQLNGIYAVLSYQSAKGEMVTAPLRPYGIPETASAVMPAGVIRLAGLRENEVAFTVGPSDAPKKGTGYSVAVFLPNGEKLLANGMIPAVDIGHVRCALPSTVFTKPGSAIAIQGQTGELPALPVDMEVRYWFQTERIESASYAMSPTKVHEILELVSTPVYTIPESLASESVDFLVTSQLVLVDKDKKVIVAESIPSECIVHVVPQPAGRIEISGSLPSTLYEEIGNSTAPIWIGLFDGRELPAIAQGTPSSIFEPVVKAPVEQAGNHFRLEARISEFTREALVPIIWIDRVADGKLGAEEFREYQPHILRVFRGAVYALGEDGVVVATASSENPKLVLPPTQPAPVSQVIR